MNVSTVNKILSPKLADITFENEYKKKGAVIIKDFISSEIITECNALFKKYSSVEIPKQNIWFSTVNLAFETGWELSQKLLDLLQPSIEKHFSGYRVEMATLLCKFPETESFLHLHRDGTIADETRFEYRNVWIPLVDLTEENGCFFYIPGSHKIFTEPCFRDTPYVFDSQFELYKPYLEYFKGKAGEAFVYSEKTLHGSFYNKSGQPRPALHFGLLHPETQLLDIIKTAPNTYKSYKTDIRKMYERDPEKKHYNEEHQTNEFQFIPTTFSDSEKLILLQKCKTNSI